MAQFVDDAASEAGKKRKRVEKAHDDPTTQSFYYMCTWHHIEMIPTPELFDEARRNITYMVYQLEKGEKTQKLHYQCYFEFKSKTRLGALEKQFPYGFWERRTGTAMQAINYCTKTATRQSEPVIWGTPSKDIQTVAEVLPALQLGQKKVSQLALACNQLLQHGCSMKQLAKSKPAVFVRHANGLSKLATMVAQKRDFKTKIFVYYGMPGSGKSRLAKENANFMFGEDDVYYYSKISASPGTEWWEGYMGEKCVIIDEFDHTVLDWNRTLNLFDRYPIKVAFKGGSYEFAPEVIFVTSNNPPSSWFYGLHEFPALRRRINETRKFVLIPDEKDEYANLVFEAQLDLPEMCDPSPKDYNAWLTLINTQSEFIGKRTAPETISFEDFHKIIDEKEKEEEYAAIDRSDSGFWEEFFNTN